MSRAATEPTSSRRHRSPTAGRAAGRGRGAVGPALRRLRQRARNLGLVAVLVRARASSAWSPPTRSSPRSNLLTILTSASVIGVITVGVTFVIIGGGIDLSVGQADGAGVGLGARRWPPSPTARCVMVLCALLVGAGCGLVNGLLIAYGRLVPFIVTLAMLVSAQGSGRADLGADRSQIVTDPTINGHRHHRLLGIPLLVCIFAAVVAVGLGGAQPDHVRPPHLRHRRQRRGGPAGRASTSAGTPSLLYVAVRALLRHRRDHDHGSLTTTGSSTHGNLYELDAIAAVIIGGTLLSGGRGTLIGSMLGVLVFTTITNIFILNNLATDVQNIAKGVIIVAAVLLQRRAARAPLLGCHRRLRPSSRMPDPIEGECLACADLPASDLRRRQLAARRRRRSAPAPRSPPAPATARPPRRPAAERGRRRAATTTRPARPSPSASPRPPPTTAGSPRSPPTPRRRPASTPTSRFEAVEGEQRRQPADRQVADADRQEGRRAGDPALRRQGADRRSAIKAMEAGIPVINLDRVFDSPRRIATWIGGDNYGMGVGRRHATSASS